MDYLTNYYKNLSEQLQQQINHLERLVEAQQSNLSEDILNELNVRQAYNQGGLGGAFHAFLGNVKQRGIMGALSGEGAIKSTEKKIKKKMDSSSDLRQQGETLERKAKVGLESLEDTHVGTAKKVAEKSGRDVKAAEEKATKEMQADPLYKKDKMDLERGEAMTSKAKSEFDAAENAKGRLGKLKVSLSALERGDSATAGMHHPFLQGYNWKNQKPDEIAPGEEPHSIRPTVETDLDYSTGEKVATNVNREKPGKNWSLKRFGQR
jgi:hypothetical protein